MSLLPVGFGSSGGVDVDVGDIANSLRFRSSASAYLSRTFGTPTLNTKLTISFWIKVGKIASTMQYLFTGFSGSQDNVVFNFNSTTGEGILGYAMGGVGQVYTKATFRDPSSWCHIVVVYDSTQGTSSNRVRFWLNGNELEKNASSVYPGSARATYLNYAGASGIIGNGYSSSSYFDGYLARTCFIDGTAATNADSFGYLNTQINEWVSKSQSAVKAVVDAGGTNSFMLDFDDATSLTTLGYDKSSKGNNWTCTGISLTAGATYDWMLDVPGNSYAVMNVLTPVSSQSTLSNGNLVVTNAISAGAGAVVASTFNMIGGKYYFEYTYSGSPSPGVGVGNTIATTNGGIGMQGSGHIAWFAGAYQAIYKNTVVLTSSVTFTTSDIVGIAFDGISDTVSFYKNGTLIGTYSYGLGDAYVLTGDQQSNLGALTHKFNFGQYPFATGATHYPDAGGYFRYTPPTGFLALCQANLETPAILNPKEHFDVKTRTGTGASANISGYQFAPGFVWIKSRGRAVDHGLYDIVRGVQKQLESNQTGIETTEATGLTAFNSDGYTLGALDQLNATTATNSYVDWAWKAGGAGVSNTAGTITSTVSANVEAGFSIVTYTGTGANATVGHGLGASPKLIINKPRNVAGNWPVYHGSMTNLEYVYLNLTNAKASLAAMWNSTSPTSSVFSIGTNSNINTNGQTMVAYCFAEIPGYSKIGSYTGNGSTDGPFVFCGFKPRWVMVKYLGGSDWEIYDTARDTENVADAYIAANSAVAESTVANHDFTANGFKIRFTNVTWNVNGGTYIFAAFADVPGKYSNAR